MTIDNNKIKIEIWDTAGDKTKLPLGLPFCNGSHCCVIIFDITNK